MTRPAEGFSLLSELARLPGVSAVEYSSSGVYVVHPSAGEETYRVERVEGGWEWVHLSAVEDVLDSGLVDREDTLLARVERWSAYR